MSAGVTTNYGFKKPNFNVRPWDSDLNGNFDLLDAILYTLTQIPNIGGVWRNSTQYNAGQNVLDGQSLTFYQCLVSKVSAATGTFAADRAANPTNWTVTSAGQGVIRYDQGQVLTAAQQAQARTNIAAIDASVLSSFAAVRFDIAQAFTYQQILQVLNNLLIDGTETTLTASATTDIGNAQSQNVVVNGNANITSFGARPNKYKLIRFATTTTLVNGASLLLPTGANILTQAGDTCIATSDANGVWYVRAYQRIDGNSLAVLGYTPVQQGTGIGQLNNTIKIGYSGSRPKLTVDTTDFGELWTGLFANLTTNTNGYLKLPNGFILQWVTVDLSQNADKAFNWPVQFPNALLGHASSAEVGDTAATSAYALKLDTVGASSGNVRIRTITNGGNVGLSAGSNFARIIGVGY